MLKYSILYVVFSSKEVAQQIAKLAIENKLVACANLLPGMTSIYQWQGKMEVRNECVALLKTLTSKVEEASDFIASIHQYECPCIIAIPVESGNKIYLDWLEQQLV